MSLAITFCLVLLQHRPRRHFLSTGLLRTLLDMLALPLLFCVHAAKMFFIWHRLVFHNILLLSRSST